MVISNIKIDIVYLEYANIGLICKLFQSDSHFLGFKKAQKAHNRRYFFLHIAFFTQNTKTLLGEKGIELSLILATLNSYLIWWTGGSLGTGPYVRVDTITDDASGLKRLGLYKLEDIHLMMNLSQTHYYFINVGGSNKTSGSELLLYQV